MPKVSVCLAVYKTKSEYLKECIESILRQTYADFEFLIVDDCPEDKECEKIIQSYKDERIKYYRNEKNLGISGTRNKLLELAQGEYIAVMDHDDVSLPTRFEKQVAYLDEHPECGVVGSWYKKIPNGKIKKKKENNAQIVNALKNSCPILHPASMIRKSAFIDNDIRYQPQFTPAEDYALWFDLVGKVNFHNIQEVLFAYREHEGNTSKEYAKRMIELRKQLIQKNKHEHPELFGVKGLLNCCFGLSEKKIEAKAAKMYKKYILNGFATLSDTSSLLKIFNTELISKHKRGVIFASYNAEQKITDEVLYYLKNLKKYSDFIVFVADNSIEESEVQKLKGLADIAYFQRHGEYDFGSYKRGYNLAAQQGWLSQIDHLVFANDSIWGPFGDMSDFFEKASRTDFYGLSGNTHGYVIGKQKIYNIGCRHIQSYLFVLSKKFFMNQEFVTFINSVSKLPNKIEVIIKYEQGMSCLARKLGLKPETYLPVQKDITKQNWKDLLQKGLFIKKRQLKKISRSDFEKLSKTMKQNFLCWDKRQGGLV